MNRRKNAWIGMLLLTAVAGCTSFQRDKDVSRDQWEPPVETAAAAK